jgi:hypothetical protein
MKKSSPFYLRHDVLINNLIAWGIPTIFATVALACGQIGYVTSYYCGPALDKGQALLWVPLLVYISIASLLQFWTLIEIEEVIPLPQTFFVLMSGIELIEDCEEITQTRQW